MIALLPAAAGSTPLTSTTSSVLRHLDAALVTDLLVTAAPALGEDLPPGATAVAVLAEGRDGRRVSGSARELLRGPARRLLVVTADRSEPGWVTALGAVAARLDRAVVWCCSADLAAAVDGALASGALTERSRTVLAELLAYWDAHGLRELHDTVVVAGRSAWPEYLRTGGLVLGDGFGDLRGGTTHVGFLVDDAIADVVPAITAAHRAVRFTSVEAERLRARGEVALAELVDSALAEGTQREGSTRSVLLLSPPTADATVRLPARVGDDATTPGGRRAPWTVSQRYTELERLRGGATATSQL